MLHFFIKGRKIIKIVSEIIARKITTSNVAARKIIERNKGQGWDTDISKIKAANMIAGNIIAKNYLSMH